ncbi:LacI family DNA-binding transcriptional regulator [Pelagibacterium halotolerans]|uniref:Transcriptional regulator n=1 Tax=Pelagibacterium halotolerans (strain DSM 22347 / JCM 15775 / CGMCC 1.7692 / B2) TaxID=1082931 RepID=G4R6D7_PELHB|nr:LacI family DNA-binding transcriptional regulator [Pelagibacterium halotolerans]AEQ53202.1 transcriptional regulator [Pelagibacterium halotolerans B2]QJR17160.1 LacI family DNA-binding transcriptional regulator [Pelagibacterium halotolerans]SEA89979.1 transcriptional regulator, LacI family [Pelagibacterium halotolerans]
MGKGKDARLSDVARAAGVSQGTVSNVFNRPQLVRAEVREQVRLAAERLGYGGPDPKGRLLRAGKVNAIGVATSEQLGYFFEDPFARTLMQGITEACDANGTGISLVSAIPDEALAWNMHNALVDGFILFCLVGADRLIAHSRERKLPFVALAFGETDESISIIGIDNVAGARLAAHHLVDLGHRRFAVLALEFESGRAGPAGLADVETAIYPAPRERLRGYFEVLTGAGIDVATVPIYNTLNDAETVAAGLEYIFSLEEKPTAILAQSDRIALEAMTWLRRHGYAVPGDVSVVGFDGVPEAALSEPPLTTISQPITELGRRAVNAILNPQAKPVQEYLEIELSVRGSTAAPRS